jgi:hypothetical protein
MPTSKVIFLPPLKKKLSSTQTSRRTGSSREGPVSLLQKKGTLQEKLSQILKDDHGKER